MSCFQRLPLRKRGRGSDENEPAMMSVGQSPALLTRETTWQRECSECLAAPPGAPPCLFCSFSQPKYFACILKASLNVCDDFCTNCGADGQECGLCSAAAGFQYNNYYRGVVAETDPTTMASRFQPATVSRSLSPGVIKLEDSYSNAPVPAKSEWNHNIRRYYPSLVSSAPGPPLSEGRRYPAMSTPLISRRFNTTARDSYYCKLPPTSPGFGVTSDSESLELIPPSRTNKTNNKTKVTGFAYSPENNIYSRQRAIRTTVNDVAVARRTPSVSELAGMSSAATIRMDMGFQALSSSRDDFREDYEAPGHHRQGFNLSTSSLASMTSPWPPTTQFSTHQSHQTSQGAQWASRYCHQNASRGPGSPSLRQTQMINHQGEAFSSDEDASLCREDINTATMSRHRIWSSSHNLQGRRFNDIPESRAAVSPQPVAGRKGPSGTHCLSGCRCGRSSQPTFRLPGEHPSASRWCDKCPTKPWHAVSDSVGVAPMFKKRRVGDTKTVTAGPRIGPPAMVPEPSTRTAPESLTVNKSPDSEPPHARTVGAKAKKRGCLCGSSQPNFGLPGEPASSARWCSNCPDKPPHAVNVKNKRCLCGSSQPSFGLPGRDRAVARWCSKCPDKPANAVDVKHKRCMCSASIPNFGLPGEPATAARWCSKCPDKPPNAIDVKNKRCECGASQPSLGLPGDPPTAARWCSKCPRKPPHAVGVKSKRCKCGISQPSFGLPGEPAALARWCNKCPDKAPNAVNLKSKKCRCGSSVPSFGLLGEPSSAARWCSKCPDKPENATDVKNKNYKRCACHHGIPTFGLPGKEPWSSIVLQWCSKCPGRPPSAVEFDVRTEGTAGRRRWS